MDADTVTASSDKMPWTAEDSRDITMTYTPNSRNSETKSRIPQSTPTSRMSSSLKERLKKCGRYHPATPLSSQTPSSGHRQGISLGHTPTSYSTNSSPKSIKRVCPQPRNILMDKSTGSSLCTKTMNVPVLTEDNTFDNVHSSDVQDTNVERNGSHTCGALKGPGLCETASVIKDHECKGNSTVDPHPQPHLRTEPTKKQILKKAGGEDEIESKTDLSLCKGISLSEHITRMKLAKKQLNEKLAERKEVLRKLNMVKLYRAKNDLSDLQKLIDKWRCVCQEAVLELHKLTSEPRPSLSLLMQQLGIDKELVHFNEENECFDD